MNRGNYRQDLFTVHKTGEAFEKGLFEVCERFGWRLHAYVIMSNHFRLALETPEANLVSGMQWLQSTFANRFNRFVGSVGHVFQGRYKALVMEEGGEALLQVVNYIHLNPVRAKVVTLDQLRRYPLCSYGRFFKRWRPACMINEDWLEEAGGWTATGWGMRAYERYLKLVAEEEPEEREKLARRLTRGWYIGSKEGKKALFNYWYGKRLESDEEEDLRKHGEDGAELLLESGLKKLRRGRERLSVTPKGAEFKLALVWWIKSLTGVSNRWLSENLNMGHIANMSSQVARYGRERASKCRYAKRLK